MKVVILAGGFGTRISEESHIRPKPMIEIGGKPILWHIMKIYSHYGHNDFIILCGYKSHIIKEYFSNYALHNSDVTFSMRTNEVKVHSNTSEPWEVTVVDTGEKTMTGGRLKRVQKYLEGEEAFFFTYGDGVGDIDIPATLEFHRDHGAYVTVTATQPSGRFGIMNVDGAYVADFLEKPSSGGGSINSGFFVLSPEVFRYIKDDGTIWEREPMERLAADNRMIAYQHQGFWQPMDTLRDKRQLESLWEKNEAPWKVWA